MKILILNDYFGPSAGGFVVAYNLALECRKRGHQIAFVTTVQTPSEAGLHEHEGFPVYRLYTAYPLRFRGLVSIWNPSIFKEFRRILREFQPDVVHAHIIHMYLSHYVLKLAHEAGIPALLTAHDTMTFCYIRLREACSPHGTALHQARMLECLQCQRFRYVPFRNACLRHYINRYAFRVISVSNALKAGLELNGIQHVQTVYNGLDPDRYAVTTEQVRAFRQKFALKGAPVLLFAGRASESKGIESLIDALPAIVAAVPETRLLMLCGARNAYIDRLRQRAEALGVAARLVFPGWLTGDELRSAYAAGDVCVVPSIQFEPLATVCLEAMAMRKPVVGTTVGGTPEMIVDGKTGYLVSPRRPEELSEKVIDVLQVPERAHQFGEAGYRRIVENFHITCQTTHILALYTEAIEYWRHHSSSRLHQEL